MTSQGFDEPAGAGDGPGAAAVDEVERYAAEVRAELADLSADESAELLEDLEDHLREVAAEDAGVLRERLGEPAAYAAELRESAGLPPRRPMGAEAPAGPARNPRRRLADVVAAAEDRVRANKYGAETLAFLPTLRPAWWVLRAWIAVRLLEVLTVSDSNNSRLSIVPRVGGSLLLGLPILVGAIMASIWIARRGPSEIRWRRASLVTAQAALVLFALLTYAKSDNGDTFHGTGASYVAQSQPGLAEDGRPVTNISVYDKDGKLLSGVYLYDQDGTPIQVDDGSRSKDFDIPGSVYAPATWLDADGVFIDNLYPRENQVRAQTSTGMRLVPVPGPATSRAVPKPVTHVPGGPQDCAIVWVQAQNGVSRAVCQGRIDGSLLMRGPGTAATATTGSSPSPNPSATPAQPGASPAPSAPTGSTPPPSPVPSTSSP